MKHIYIVDLESVETRYTCEWKDHIPFMLEEALMRRNISDVEIINISGGEDSIEASPGAFLNFQQTNIYKNNQLNDIARRFTDEVSPGDKFVFADAWHPGILQLKYMSELLQVPVEIHGLWHAGSYDPQDFLGRLIKDKRWSNCAEQAFFHAIDYNWFATDFHIELFQKGVFKDNLYWEMSDDEIENKFRRTGWPMEYMPTTLEPYKDTPKEDIIIFPHRLAPEKQPDIFEDLRQSMPQYKFIVCQDLNLTKPEYHKLLARSKLMFSANLQETLGISPYEGALLDVRPFVPNRLSYTEMFPEEYMYPSDWTESFDRYIWFKQIMMEKINMLMKKPPESHKALADSLSYNFFSARRLVNKLLEK